MSSQSQTSVLGRTVGILRQRAGALFLLQLPVAATSLVEPAPSEGIQNNTQLILILSIVFPIFVFLSTLSSTATFALVRGEVGALPVSAKTAALESLRRWKKWFPAGIVLALLTIPGAFAPILIPVAVYFSAIYGFAPFLAMESPDAPMSVLFHRSRQLVKKALWQMLGIAGLLMIMEFGLAFSASDLGVRIGAMAPTPAIGSALALATQFLLSLGMSLLISPLLAVFFFKLRSEP